MPFLFIVVPNIRSLAGLALKIPLFIERILDCLCIIYLRVILLP